MRKHSRLILCALVCAGGIISLCGCQGEKKSDFNASSLPENSRPITGNEAPRGDRLRGPASGSQPPGPPGSAPPAPHQ